MKFKKKSPLSSEGEELFEGTRKKIIVAITIIVSFVMVLFSLVVMAIFTFDAFGSADDGIKIRSSNSVAAVKNFYADGSDSQYDGLKNNIFKISKEEEEKTANGLNLKYLTFVVFENELIWSTENDFFEEAQYPNLDFFEDNRISSFVVNGQKFRGAMFSHGNITVLNIVNVEPVYNGIARVVLSVIVGFCLVMIAVIAVAFRYSRVIIKPIKEAYMKQVLFVQDASHEMRTPLSVLKSKIELLAQNPENSIEFHSKELSEMVSEITSMEKMNKNLLLLSKEDIYSKHNSTEFSIRDMLCTLSDDLFSLLAEVQNKNFEFSVEPDIYVKWDYDKMKQALTILLDNAFKYTSPGDKISVTAVSDGNKVIINVYDTGKGIKSEDLPRVFDRFFRAEDSRAGNVSGSGIGLSILRSFASNLGFSVKVASEYGSFTEFTITAPIVMK